MRAVWIVLSVPLGLITLFGVINMIEAGPEPWPVVAASAGLTAGCIALFVRADRRARRKHASGVSQHA